ncbi:helix-turn-helix transcriptional regulator [Streptomyces sp. ST2-7A]|uniref:helix-turn-helix domain-containing protein n=1 Tax=Streptomyces sp. ST2-7A TaxID=2907214 RepID=UPI001F18BE36|nr:helix-turn-helix transcriptional regulator [Streptomyces sp. ST2-7A]MCE7079262.1 helix-turn-helix domain-containing protein [Streptomyces sp. ST2-7A]
MTERNLDMRQSGARDLMATSLKAHRARAGLSVRALGKEINFTHGYIARVETGTQMPSESLTRALDAHFETDGLFAGLMVLASHDGAPNYSRAALMKERTAVRIQVLTGNTLPGLLQTPEYARALFASAAPKAPPETFDDAVILRRERSHTALEREEPAFYWAIMDEAALARPVGGKEIMCEALRHMHTMTCRQNIVVQVLPFTAGAYSMLGGSFTALTGPDGSCMTYVESFSSGATIEEPRRVAELLHQFDHSQARALPESESLEMIEQYERRYADE